MHVAKLISRFFKIVQVLLLRTGSDVFYHGCSTLLMTGISACVAMSVIPLTYTKPGLDWPWQCEPTASGKISLFIRVKTFWINIRKIDLGSRRPLGANRLQTLVDAHRQDRCNNSQRICLQSAKYREKSFLNNFTNYLIIASEQTEIYYELYKESR